MKHLSKSVAVLGSVLILSGLVLFVLERTNTTHLFHDAQPDSSQSGVNYEPPTKSAVKDSESHKDTPPSDTNTDGTAPTPTTGTDSKKTKVQVEISTWAQDSDSLNVNGFVTGVVEDGGTCTLKLVAKSDGKTVTQSRHAVSNATNTSCGVTEVPLSKLHTGTWAATLSYSSPNYAGASDANDLEVQ